MLLLEYETQIGEKKYWTMFFNQIAVHMQNFVQIWEKWKNGLKFDIGRLCSQPFHYNVLIYFITLGGRAFSSESDFLCFSS